MKKSVAFFFLFILILFVSVVYLSKDTKQKFINIFPSSYVTLTNKHSDYKFKIDNYSALLKFLDERKISTIGISYRTNSPIPINSIEISIDERKYNKLSTNYQTDVSSYSIISSDFNIGGTKLFINIGLDKSEIENGGLNKKYIEEYVNRQLIDTIILTSQKHNINYPIPLNSDLSSENSKKALETYYNQQSKKIISSINK